MPLDPSVILAAQPPAPLNPLAVMGQVAQVGEATQQNKLLQQKVQTNQAVNDATRAATDPNTGQVDPNKLMGILSQDSRAQADLPGIMNQMQQYQVGQYKLAQDHLANMSGRISTLLETPPGALTQKSVLQSMGSMLSEGLITPNEFATETTGMPSDEAGLRQWLTGHLNRTLDGQQKVNNILGGTTATNVGGAIQMGTQSPETGYHPQANISLGLSPSEVATPTQTGVTAAGAPVEGTRGQFLQETGANVPQGGVVTPAAGVGAVTGAPPQAGATGVAAAPAPAAGPPSAAPPAGQGGPPGVPMGLSPAAQQYQTGAGQEAAAYKADIDTRTNAGANLVMRMGESLKALSEYHPGAAAPIRSQLAQDAQKWGAPQPLVDKINGGNLGATQEYQKLAVQQATEALKQALGSNRIAVMEFDQFQKSNPNLSTDPRAIQKMYQFATKVYQKDAAEQQAFQGYSSAGGDVTQFPAYWQNQMVKRGMIDPAAITQATRPGAPAPGLAPHGKPAPTSSGPGRKSLADIFG